MIVRPRWYHYLLALAATGAGIWDLTHPVEGVQQAAFLTMLLLSLALGAISFLLTPRPEGPEPAGLGDFNFPTATEGRPVPVVWGTVKLSGPNVVWYGDFRAVEIRQDVSFAPDPVVGHKYAHGMQMALCEGQLGALRRIWVGDKLLWDGVTPSAPSGDGGVLEFNTAETHGFYGGDSVGGNGGIVGRLRYYDGRSTQTTPDDYLSPTFQNPGLGYIGTAYLVWEGPSEGELTYLHSLGGFDVPYTAPIGYLGNSTQIDAWAFEVNRFPNTLGITAGKEIVNTFDANPAAVIYEILTNTSWGMGIAPSLIDTAAFLAAADTLWDEGNGFSWVLDREMEGPDILEVVEEQIDGYVDIDRTSGQWTITLARGGYTVGALPALDSSNVLRAENYREQTWADTESIVRVKYTTRDTKGENYKETHAIAQDMGNIQIQGKTKPVNLSFPGVKDGTLAAKLATRELRQLTSPKRSATLICNQTVYEATLGDLYRWTDTKRGFTDVPVRVTEIEPGSPESGEIVLTVVEDVFQTDPAIFGAPEDTDWTPPSATLVAIPIDEDLILEIPRMLALRDDAQPGAIDRLFCGARYQGDGATGVRVYQRNAAGTPTGSYTLEDREITSFLRIGQLNADLDQDTGNPTLAPTEDIRVDDTPDDVISLLTQGVDDTTLGEALVNLVLIEDEFLLATTFSDGSGFVTLSDVWRGVGDTTVKAHPAGTDVFLVTGVSGSTTIPRGNNVDVQLVGFYGLEEAASPNTVALTMDDRARRPYPPNDLLLGEDSSETRYPAGPLDLDSTTSQGSGDDDVGFNALWTRRDFTIFDELDNVSGTVGSGFPSDVSHENRVSVYDTTSTPTLLYSTAWAEKAADLVNRTLVLAETDGVVPDSLRIDIETRHDFEAETFEATQQESWEVDVESTLLDPLTNTGARDENTASDVLVAGETGTYTFTIATSVLSSGVLEARINGGSWTTVISTSGTTGTLAGVTSGDDVEWRHTQASGGVSTLLLIEAPSAANEAYGIVKT